jgi:glycosyltransferase involved in cell wall biosynthesis
LSRIVTVYSPELRAGRLVEMARIRWYRISAALAQLGHQVDIASAEFTRRLRTAQSLGPNLRVVPITRVRWERYDVVKTLFHLGFATLEHYGGAEHPFLIAKLGSVVGPRDLEGIYFFGAQRQHLYAVQERIARAARHVTLLSPPAESLWRDCFPGTSTLLVPGATDEEIPPPRQNPYPADDRKHCVFAGNFYSGGEGSQPEAHHSVADRLNRLGALLDTRGARLHVVGPGDARSLDPRHVTYHPPVEYERSWDFLHFAAVGIVIAAGPFMHNNESTKIYSYLRAGLPVVSEAGFPNDQVVRESGLGYVVENGRLEEMAERIVAAASAHWDRAAGIRYVLSHHTWRHRAEVYGELLHRIRPGPGGETVGPREPATLAPPSP